MRKYLPLIIPVVAAFIWLAKISPADVSACMNQTGWSEARCQIELTR